MARMQLPIGGLVSGAFVDRVGGQITAATTPSVGDVQSVVLPAGGDYGFYGAFDMPAYSGNLTVVFKGVLDGAPGAADTLGFGFRSHQPADNESADATFDAEEVASATIGSNGLAYSDEDLLVMSVGLTEGNYAAGDEIEFLAFIDDSGSSYAGNFLLTGCYLDYTPA